MRRTTVISVAVAVIALAGTAAAQSPTAAPPAPAATPAPAPAAAPPPPKPPATETTPANIRLIAGNCLVCHSESASAAGGMPILAGQDAKVIAAAFREFRDGKRHGTIMPRISKGYDDGVVDAVSAYLSKTK